MMQELEDFIDISMEEMHKEMKELKDSYEEEILELMALDKEFLPVLEKLKEERDAELDNLRSQFEVQRIQGVENIKRKYQS